MTMKTCVCFILLLLAALSLASCKESEKDTALRLVKEWDGKEIKFPGIPSSPYRVRIRWTSTSMMPITRWWLMYIPHYQQRQFLADGSECGHFLRMYEGGIRQASRSSGTDDGFWRWYTKRRKADVSQKWWLSIRMQKLPPSVYG